MNHKKTPAGHIRPIGVFDCPVMGLMFFVSENKEFSVLLSKKQD
jgi:hypothetical protein